MLGRRKKALDPVPLGDAVREVAACPCARHHESLVAALCAADELILRVTDSSQTMPDYGGRHVVGEGEQIQVATAVAPNGRSFLHAFCDLEAASGRFPEARFVGVAPQAAFRMSTSNGNAGLLVSAAGPDDVMVTADGIARLLAPDGTEAGDAGAAGDER